MHASGKKIIRFSQVCPNKQLFRYLRWCAFLCYSDRSEHELIAGEVYVASFRLHGDTNKIKL